MFCVGYEIYIRGSGAPKCIFHNQHIVLYNTFSPDPVVSCVADKQVSHHKIYTLCSILWHFIRSMPFLFSFYFGHELSHMRQMDFISSNLVRFFQNYLRSIL